MTDPYTPTTEEVREDFAFPWSPEQIGDRPARVAAFDRWLSARDAQVRAEALREAADDFAVVMHPYEGGVTGWLRDRADRISDTNQQDRRKR